MTLEKDIRKNLEPTKEDLVHTGVKTTLSAIPGVGGPASEIFAALIEPPLAKRRDKLLIDVYDGLKELEKKFDSFKIEELSQNPLFTTMITQAITIAIRNHQKEKLEALRNAVLNSSLPGSPEDNIQLMFLNYIDILTEWHLVILRFLNAPKTWKGDITPSIHDYKATIDLKKILMYNFPKLKDQYGVVEQIIRDLNTQGLINTQHLRYTTSINNFLKLSPVTRIGKQFIQFINSPID